jgi:choice-of-anchor C domain-containing protein
VSNLKKLLVGAALAAATTLGASQASAAAFMNGSFELNTADPVSFSTLGAGSNVVTGWTVFGGTVDYINGYWQAANGTHSIDLSGNGAGSIQQTFDTVAGKTYSVDYFLSGNPDSGGVAKPGVVAAIDGALIASSTFTGVKGSSHSQMDWLAQNFTFVASGASTTLRFTSNTGNPFGPAIDAVSVSAVPEPATWAMMIIGFGACGSMVRSSRRKQALAFA